MDETTGIWDQSNTSQVYTANLGQNWDIELLQYLGLEVDSKLFLFRGAPDVVIRKNTSVTTGGREVLSDSQDSSEDELVENSFQRPPIHGFHHCVPPPPSPEKLGEVFEGLHILLVCRHLCEVNNTITLVCHLFNLAVSHSLTRGYMK